MATSNIGWALVDQLAQETLPAKLLFTTGKMKRKQLLFLLWSTDCPMLLTLACP
jgi:hypothetical protein